MIKTINHGIDGIVVNGSDDDSSGLMKEAVLKRHQMTAVRSSVPSKPGMS